jgi:hypothetical protein
VAVDVDTVAIGGYNGRVNGQNGRGQGWVFTRSGTTWTQQENIIASDGAAFDQFGTSIGVSGATVISGAPWKSGAQGGAYIYSAGTTAGGAHISGRVLTPEGRGLVNAMVTVTDSKGTERTAQTGTFGNFAVENLPSGESYVVSVRSRKYQFASQVVQLQADLDGFTIQASGGRR